MPASSTLSTIPPAFAAKKTAILASLAVPQETYTDASPKGSVDEGIKPLIDRINAMKGVVTTSSCAGRVSVFLEGKKTRASSDGNAIQRSEREWDDGGGGGGRRSGERGEADALENSQAQNAVPGGKGNGGRWLFVSHEPVKYIEEGHSALTEMLGLSTETMTPNGLQKGDTNNIRYVRFQFEPMILHVMTASLHHAQPILTAAINAGFRESGVQSLKNLDDANAFPMVAVRSSGLAFESLVAWVDETEVEGKIIVSLVNGEYLKTIINIANERFKINTSRMKRFEDELPGRENLSAGWESKQSRRERKKAEGFAQQAAIQSSQNIQDHGDHLNEEDAILGSLSGPLG